MKNKFFSLIIATACLLIYADCKAQLVIDMTTGSTNGSPLPIGSVDDTWTTVYDPSSTPFPNYVSNGSLWSGGPWTPYAQNACGQWTSSYTITTPGPSFGYIAGGSTSGYWEYEMTFNNPSKCPVNSATLNLNVYGADDDLQDIIINGNPAISVGPAGYGLTASGTFTVPTGYIVPGLNTIRARVYDYGVFTGFFMCGNLTINFGSWNNTTSSSLGGDQGNDVVVDGAGNVYVCGTYTQGTDFTDPSCPPISIPGDPNPSAYIAKYDNCGKLLWVNFDNGTGYTRGTGIDYDPVRNLVYMTGTEGPDLVQFQKPAALPCGPPPVAVPPTLARHYYVAKFDANSGDFIDITHRTIGSAITVKPNTYIAVSNISSSTTEIYLVESFINSKDEMIQVEKLSEAGGTYTSVWLNQTFASGTAMFKVANDIAYNKPAARVYITGTFSNRITFNATTLNTGAATEAFVWEFNSASGASTAAQKLGLPFVTTNVAEGNSVVVLGSRIYATGDFNAGIPSVFGSALTLPGGTGNLSAYTVGFVPGLGASWAQEIDAVPGSDIHSMGIASSPGTGQIITTGMLTGNIVSPGVMTPNGVYVSATPGMPKMYVAGYSSTGTPLWSNTATDATPNSRHNATKIAATNSESFSTGGYTNEFNYFYASVTPPSGPLMATPAGNMSSYFVRNNITMQGAFFKTSTETALDEPAKNLALNNGSNIVVFPNPSSGVFTIDLGKLSTSGKENIEVYDMMGKKVEQLSTSSMQSTYSLDLSGQPKGIYLIKVLSNNKAEMTQIQVR